MPRKHATTLGRSSVAVTWLSLGTGPIGGMYSAVSDEQASATIERAWDLGVRYFDTAPAYGLGESEERLGRALAKRPRDEYVVATKVGRLLRRDPSPDLALDLAAPQLFKSSTGLTPVYDYSYDAALLSLEESLTRLGLDRVDIVYIHDPDDFYDDALNGAYRALRELREQGVVGAIGVGMNQAEMLTRFAREAEFDCFLIAGRYTLLDQRAREELIPTCEELGISLVAAGVFNGGILADPEKRPVFDYAPAQPEVLARAKAIDALCREHGVPLAALAVQFPLAEPAYATTLVGACSPEEVEHNVRAFATAVPAALWDALRNEGLLPRDVAVPGETPDRGVRA
ncbi:MAG: D-threo-aldose 1-dehydrogenase [Solirubrobacteraceae bacterium]